MAQECKELAKDKLTSAEVLTHYNPALPINLAADASAYGVGAVISHIFPNGSERPIAFAPRTLSTSEKNYAQLEKDALSLVFGVKKFHQYLYGRRFTLILEKIQEAISRDTVLSKVLIYVQNGWPDEVEEYIKPYKSRQNEIVIETGCLMWGIRVIVQRIYNRIFLHHYITITPKSLA